MIQRVLVLPMILLASALGARPADAPGPAPADQVLTAAETEGAAEHKSVWVIFGASWCGWCRQLDKFIDAPDVRPLLQQHFVITHLTVEEHADKATLDNPGGEDVKNRLGGSKESGLPFFAFLDSTGQLVVNSNRPVTGKPGVNVGFPSAPEEVDWFMTMLRQAAPSLTPADAQTLEGKLRKQARH
jgi:thioredoxin-related protein